MSCCASEHTAGMGPTPGLWPRRAAVMSWRTLSGIGVARRRRVWTFYGRLDPAGAAVAATRRAAARAKRGPWPASPRPPPLQSPRPRQQPRSTAATSYRRRLLWGESAAASTGRCGEAGSGGGRATPWVSIAAASRVSPTRSPPASSASSRLARRLVCCSSSRATTLASAVAVAAQAALMAQARGKDPRAFRPCFYELGWLIFTCRARDKGLFQIPS
mmetsp:Transcript_117644/g.293287  ORF Transcript_117644/g.293287 Transcript_117644/m.293287 type:complete len:217 (-) Transcript_117644:79-729(-)